MSQSAQLNITWSFDTNSVTSRNATAYAFLGYFSKKVTSMVQWRSLRYEPVSLKILKHMYSYFINPSSSSGTLSTPRVNITFSNGAIPRSDTWLSDVPVLKNLTRSTTINNVVIDTLEGQLITILVVTAFILLFLIREWVMQQQQNLVIGPDGNVQEPAGPNIEGPEQQEQVNPAAGQPRGEANQAADAPPNVDDDRRRNHGGRIFARPRIRRHRPRPLAPEDPQARRTNSNRSEISINDMVDQNQLSWELQDAQNTEYTNFKVTAELSQQFKQEFDASKAGTHFMRLREESPMFRSAWVRSNFSLPRAIEIVEEQNNNGFFDDLIDDMQRLNPSPFFTGNLGRVLKGRCIADEPDNRIEEENRKETTEQSSPEGEHPNDESAELGFTLLDRPPNGSFKYGVSEIPTATQWRFSDESTAKNPGDEELHTTTRPKSALDFGNGEGTKDDGGVGSSTEQSNPDAVDTTGYSVPDDDEIQLEDGITTIPNSPINMSRRGSIDATTPEPPSEETADAVPLNMTSEAAMPDQETSDPTVEETEEDQSRLERIKNWLWGGVNLPVVHGDNHAGDDEQVVNDINEEAPFVPVAHGQHLLQAVEQNENAPQDPEVVAAAVQAGIDPNGAEAAEEMEDLEGIMELIGMEGPIIGLVQNGMFFAVLVSLTILFGLWVPYVFGKTFLIVLARPFAVSIKFLRFASTFADMVTDLLIFLSGCALYWIDLLVNAVCAPVGYVLPSLKRFTDNQIVAQTAKKYAENAIGRLAKASIFTGDSLVETFDVPTVSAIAHESLLHIKLQAASSLKVAFQVYEDAIAPLAAPQGIFHGLAYAMIGIITKAKALISACVEATLRFFGSGHVLQRINPLNINLAPQQRSVPLDFDLAVWDGTDRAIAIVSGYVFFAILGMIYLRLAASIQGTNKRGTVEGNFASILYQAGGVVKVILIISIEMLLFPLYCGVLLDIALLPLFDNATFLSRVDFTVNSPWTSTFIHWFVGTCYMFHFALFISMCRKIMRTGVLFFIRDPDDPTVHPVRDVLERNVSTQLWKISLSALVCGGLVFIGLGVVWTIGSVFKGIFPIHWSSTEPVLEFPVDLLFYNFLMPFTIKAFKPSKGLKTMYSWWFRRCARALRLSHFLFDVKQEDEEGRHVRQTWTGALKGEKGDYKNPIVGEDRKVLAQDRNVRAYFLRDGGYVRAPASDSVRLPAGASAFLEVDAENNRRDGGEDKEDGLHGRNNKQFKQVYMPPHFRLRIAAFLLLVWLFATATCICVTIVPLAFGRWVLSTITPQHVRMNDIYAFSTGIYILTTIGFILLSYQKIINYAREKIIPNRTTITNFLRRARSVAIHAFKVTYTYGSFGVLLPLAFSMILEFYIIIPLHTYITYNPASTGQDQGSSMFSSSRPGDSLASTSRPIIHLVQDWTLGVLYLKVFARLILWSAPSRPAQALRGIVRDGWLNPDARLATRAFIFPATVVLAAVLCIPVAFGWVANRTVFHAFVKQEALHATLVYRYSYPAALAIVTTGVVTWLLGRAFRRWRKRVRDEVYLIGERLHNFGEGKKRGGISKAKAGKVKQL